MAKQLRISTGQYSDKGRKEINQDFHWDLPAGRTAPQCEGNRDCLGRCRVIKSTTAHLFHVGDSRIYRVHDNALEQPTVDHRMWVSQQQSHLSRALGVAVQLEIDYRTLLVDVGDTFVLATDGVYEYADARFIIDSIRASADDLGQAAQQVVEEALRRGSGDNLTVQIVRIELPGRARRRESATTCTSPPNSSTAKPWRNGWPTMRSRNWTSCAALSNKSPRECRRFTAWKCCTKTCDRPTS